MKKIIGLFFLCTFFACPLFAAGDGGQGTGSINGTFGFTENVDFKSDGKVAVGCDNKKLGATCIANNGYIKGECIQSTATEKGCKALACKEDWWLDLNAGICITDKTARERCSKKKKCSDGNPQVPYPEKNTNPGFDDNRTFRKCFCAGYFPVSYDCGDADAGKAPQDDKEYTTSDEIPTKPNTCKKTGASFIGWLCGSNTDLIQPGETFQIEDAYEVTCTAQWEWNKYTVKFEGGTGTEGSIPDKEIVYNNAIQMPGWDQITKKGFTLDGWKCGNNLLKIGDNFTVLDNTACVAQWKACPKCEPGNGCDCELTVENNQCKYITKPKNGFVLIAGDSTTKPQCIDEKQKDCEDSGGEWVNGECLCKPQIKGTHWDIFAKACVCDDNNLLLIDGKCVPVPIVSEDEIEEIPVPEKPKCDDDEEYVNGKCVCKDRTKTKGSDGKCSAITKLPVQVSPIEQSGAGDITLPAEKEPECDTGFHGTASDKCCPDGVADWNEEEEGCSCRDKGKIYDPGTKTCKCPDDKPKYVDGECKAVEVEEPEECPSGTTGTMPNCKCDDADKKYNPDTKECECKDGFKEDENGKCVNKLEELEEKYTGLKEKEQSLENRMLGGLTMAATGIGGMELAQGLAEQKAAAAAEQDMSAYIATFRCTYGKDKSVKGGPDEIELPGGNDANMMKYRNEYMTLAADLKVRKEALEMKPGIESEEILDKSQMGLYDQENTGIESGVYASLYRAKALGSEEDQAKLDEEAKKSKARVIGGATALGVGVVGGMIGNSLINGKLGEKIKEKKKNKNIKTVSVLEKNKKITVLSDEDLEKEMIKAGLKK